MCTKRKRGKTCSRYDMLGAQENIEEEHTLGIMHSGCKEEGGNTLKCDVLWVLGRKHVHLPLC